jgi:Ca2+/Na+ antiporter
MTYEFATWHLFLLFFGGFLVGFFAAALFAKQ